MKLRFFGKGNSKLDSHLIIYILGFLAPIDLARVASVNKSWQKYVALLSAMRRIPLLEGASSDFSKIEELSGGMTNTTFQLDMRSSDEQYVLRVPGKGSSAFIHRGHEAHNAMQASKPLKLNVPIEYFDPQDGLQLTQYIADAHSLDSKMLEQEDVLRMVASMMKRLHSSEPFKNSTNFFQKNEELLSRLKERQFQFPGDIQQIEEQMSRLKALFGSYSIQLSPCHNDATPLNFIRSDTTGIINEIDWEYSANNDLLWDLVYFIVEAKLSTSQQIAFLCAYFNQEQLDESIYAWIDAYKSVVEWWITLWSWTQLANQANAVDPASYERLGQERYERTMYYLQSTDYQTAVQLIEDEKESLSFSGSRPF